MTKFFASIGVAMAVQTAFAGNITDINVSTLPDSQKIIKIRFDRDVTSPSGFVTSAPARIALDFANTTIRLPQSVLEYADPLLNQITAAQNNDRSRIVLGLNNCPDKIFIRKITLKNGSPTLTKINHFEPSSVKRYEAAKCTGLSKRMIMDPSLTSSPIIKKESDLVKKLVTKLMMM